MDSSQRKCICTICDCGKHKCPHKTCNAATWGKDVCSEYSQRYTSHDSCRPQSCKPPASQVCSGDPLSNVTTNRADYVTHDVHAPQKFEKPAYEPPEGLMDGRSIYQQEYNEKPQCAPKAIRPPHTMLDNGKFQSDTTNRSTYVPWDVHAPMIKSQEKYVPPKEPFSGIPCYKSDYVEHCPQKVQSCKPPVTTIGSDVPFANMSDYRHNFIEHPAEAPLQMNKQPYIKPDAPFEGMTTNRQDYVVQDSCRPATCRPPAHRVASDQPFSSSTTNRADYIPHETKCVEQHEREKYVKPEGDMELRSTYNSDFINQPNCRAYPIRPPQNPCGNEPFDGNTSYRQNYKHWDQPANIVYHKDTYIPSVARLESETTTRASYIPHCIDKQTSCKPPAHHLEQLPFDGQTSYRADFIKRDVGSCPAESLTKNVRSVSPAGYMFDGEDCDGHIHYVKSHPMNHVTC